MQQKKYMKSSDLISEDANGSIANVLQRKECIILGRNLILSWNVKLKWIQKTTLHIALKTCIQEKNTKQHDAQDKAQKSRSTERDQATLC